MARLDLLGGFLRHMTLAALGAAIVFGANLSAEAQESRLDEVTARDKLIVATFTTAPPFCFTDESGELVGFDVDLARLIARATLGDEAKIEFMPVTSEGRWPAVLSGRADFGIASTTIYPDRAMRVAFTRPYIDSGISILVREDAGIASLDELNNSNFVLANLSNPQMADRAARFLPNTRLLTFDTPSAMFLAVQTGQAQAMQMDTPVLNWYANTHEGLKVLPENLSNIQGNAIFMAPGDFIWWRYLDTVVQEMVQGSLYSEYTEIYQKWFGRNPPPSRSYN